MITNINDSLKKCGIYKINYDNNRIYIGQALSVYSRALEHNSKNKQLCDKALKIHNATIEILEEVSDILILDEIETKWINFYNSTDKSIGYNILQEGNASEKRGIDNCNAAFSQKELEEIIDLLINNTKLSYIDIAKMYNVNKDTILRISQGYSYYNPKLKYPLRKNNHDAIKKDMIEDYFNSIESLISLKEDLLYRWDLEIEKDLSKKYNLPIKVLRDINNGRLFKNIGNYIYPIRNKNIRNNNNFSQKDVINILNDLKNSKSSMTEIGLKYNVHRDTISKINKGERYIIKNYIYPAR